MLSLLKIHFHALNYHLEILWYKYGVTKNIKEETQKQEQKD